MSFINIQLDDEPLPPETIWAKGYGWSAEYRIVLDDGAMKGFPHGDGKIRRVPVAEDTP